MALRKALRLQKNIKTAYIFFIPGFAINTSGRTVFGMKKNNIRNLPTLTKANLWLIALR